MIISSFPPIIKSDLLFRLRFQPEEVSHFAISRGTGEITLQSSLDYESARFFSLEVVAKDGGQNQRSATTEVVIVVEVSWSRGYIDRLIDGLVEFEMEPSIITVAI